MSPQDHNVLEREVTRPACSDHEDLAPTPSVIDTFSDEPGPFDEYPDGMTRPSGRKT